MKSTNKKSQCLDIVTSLFDLKLAQRTYTYYTMYSTNSPVNNRFTCIILFSPIIITPRCLVLDLFSIFIIYIIGLSFFFVLFAIIFSIQKR